MCFPVEAEVRRKSGSSNHTPGGINEMYFPSNIPGSRSLQMNYKLFRQRKWASFDQGGSCSFNADELSWWGD
ncbi:hypothetical protein CEXT_44531 [Caerostris extrusa]|uniref:Uncharacterized protein n=1 Tax=Caerostris extrusa TaxID=172846 RepID=A0AAV4Y3J5_CAEEX|nr:hypothetical protein CEXT_44531 [Caerostris extrusa]